MKHLLLFLFCSFHSLIPVAFAGSLGVTTVLGDVNVPTPHGYTLHQKGIYPEIDYMYEAMESISINHVLARFLKVDNGSVIGEADIMIEKSNEFVRHPLSSFDVNGFDSTIHSGPMITNALAFVKKSAQLLSKANSSGINLTEEELPSLYFFPSHYLSTNSFHFTTVHVRQNISSNVLVSLEYHVSSTASVWLNGHIFSLSVRMGTLNPKDLPKIVETSRNELTAWSSDLFARNRFLPNASFQKELEFQDRFVRDSLKKQERTKKRTEF